MKVFDVKTTFPVEPKPYAPENYDGKERGPISLRAALAGSLNIPAVKLLYLVGLDRVLSLAEALGYTTLKDRSRFGLSLVLGGGEVKLVEHTAAFRAILEDGIYRSPVALLRIEDQNGKIVFSVKKEDGKRVVPAEVARTTVDILSDKGARSFVFGSPSFLELPDRPVAVKTGTTNDFRDAWTLGGTPFVTSGVWTGNNDNTPMKKGADGSKIAAPIWQSFMKKVHQGKPVTEFSKPKREPSENPILRGEGIGEELLKIDRASGKLATPLTPDSYITEKKYAIFHNILHYIDKNNPIGPSPSDPTLDPHYEAWEQAVQEWAQKQKITLEEPPRDADDLHVPQNFPSVTILQPQDGSRIPDEIVTVSAESFASRGIISRVEFLLNGELLGTLPTPPYLFPLNLQSASSGFHTITVRAYDDIDNQGEAKVTINVVR